MSIIFSGTGRYIPGSAVTNDSFFNHEFYNADGERIPQPSRLIIEKFTAITGIEERRYMGKGQITSDMATIAAQITIDDAGIDAETLDGIIVAHNFGNIPSDTVQTDTVPSLATRVKNSLRIKNPNCMAFDVLYGCPGWMQGVIIAYQFLQAGNAKRFLVIGAEALSRVLDPYDRDSMIYADGAAAAVLEYVAGNDASGILSVASQTHAYDEAYYLYYGGSNNKEHAPGTRYVKMHGRKIYEFALNNVPIAMKECLDKSGIGIGEVKKVFIHQANEKMDEAIIKRFYGLYGIKQTPDNVMPMSIHMLGNSSVATVPTLLDLVRKGDLKEHHLEKGDVILLASVGAGMNITAITYRV